MLTMLGVSRPQASSGQPPHSPGGSSYLLGLPDELLVQIVELLAQPSRFDPPFNPFRSRYYILLELSKTCTRLWAVARGVLYARVHLPTPGHAALFQRTLASELGIAAGLGSMVEQIIIRDRPRNASIQNIDHPPKWLAPLLAQVASPRLAKVSLISMGISCVDLRYLAGVRDLKLAGVCLNLKAGEQVHLPVLHTLRLASCIIHRSSSLNWNQVLTLSAIPAITKIESNRLPGCALEQQLDTSAQSLLALMGRLVSLTLDEWTPWLGQNDVSLWAATTRLTDLSLGGSDISLQLHLDVILQHLPSSLARLDLGRVHLGRYGQVLHAVIAAFGDNSASLAKLQVFVMPFIMRRAPPLIVQLADEVVALAESRGVHVYDRARSET